MKRPGTQRAMGCVSSRPAGTADNDVDWEEAPGVVRDVLVSAAGEFVLAAASIAPTDHAAVRLAHGRFRLAYNILVNRARDLSEDSVAYFYARCVLNAHTANVAFEDAPAELLCDGAHRPFYPRRHRRLSV